MAYGKKTVKKGISNRPANSKPVGKPPRTPPGLSKPNKPSRRPSMGGGETTRPWPDSFLKPKPKKKGKK